MGLLLLVGAVVKGAVYLGYGVAGSYFVGTGVRYYRDYKDFTSRERG